MKKRYRKIFIERDPEPRMDRDGYFKFPQTIVVYAECDWQKSYKSRSCKKGSKARSVKVLHRRHPVQRGK
ncbi:MAG: hypothetical protein M0P76_03025 [Candidatus Pacebacteria bacterium]|nr:hypothetical protein [Candidatus Paceibacterota bacterium]